MFDFLSNSDGSDSESASLRSYQRRNDAILTVSAVLGGTDEEKIEATS
jgi:hypothetical protein